MTEGEQQISCINPFTLTSSTIKGLLLEKTLQLCANFSILVLQRVTAQWFCVQHHKGTCTSSKNTTAYCLLLLVETTSMVHLYKTTKKETVLLMC